MAISTTSGSNSETLSPALYPLTFEPVFKDYPWGGRNLATLIGRTIPEGIVAESWDIAAHPNGSSPIANGTLKGKTLQEVMTLWGVELVGSRNSEDLAQGRFPLLIKLLDANRPRLGAATTGLGITSRCGTSRGSRQKIAPNDITIPPIQIQLTSGFTIACTATTRPPCSQPPSVR